MAPYITQPFPTYTLTAEQSAEPVRLQSQLGPYVDEGLARFVMGQTELNEETIAAFREGLRERGMDEMIAFWQSVADDLGN